MITFNYQANQLPSEYEYIDQFGHTHTYDQSFDEYPAWDYLGGGKFGWKDTDHNFLGGGRLEFKVSYYRVGDDLYGIRHSFDVGDEVIVSAKFLHDPPDYCPPGYENDLLIVDIRCYLMCSTVFSDLNILERWYYYKPGGTTKWFLYYHKCWAINSSYYEISIRDPLTIRYKRTSVNNYAVYFNESYSISRTWIYGSNRNYIDVTPHFKIITGYLMGGGVYIDYQTINGKLWSPPPKGLFYTPQSRRLL